MDMTLLAPIISVIVMIGVIVFFYYKKWMMVYGIIFANFIVFFISLFFVREVIGELAFKPLYLVEQFPKLYTLFTSMFLHSPYPPFLHIIFNVFMFILIAPSFEDRIGPKKFLAIYLITGVCAALSHALIAPLFHDSIMPFNPEVGLIGASGAISGILGAYAFAFPKDRVYFPVMIIIRMPVLYAGLIFLTIQTFYTIGGGDSNVAYLAHVGGFLSGIVVAALFIKRKNEFDQPIGKRTYDYYVDQKLSKIDFSKQFHKLVTCGLNIS